MGKGTDTPSDQRRRNTKSDTATRSYLTTNVSTDAGTRHNRCPDDVCSCSDTGRCSTSSTPTGRRSDVCTGRTGTGPDTQTNQRGRNEKSNGGSNTTTNERTNGGTNTRTYP